MTTAHPTHWCVSCGKHYTRQQVRQTLPAEHTPDGEVELLICPHCGSDHVEELQEIGHDE